MTSTDRPVAGHKGGYRRAIAGLTMVLSTLTALIGSVLFAVPAQAAQVSPDDAGVITIPAVPDPALSPSSVAEITATVIAGVLILGTAFAVLYYTARHRDELLD